MGGLWLAAQRRSLGLTSDALGAALGFDGHKIRAVESGARPLTPRLRARARAYFARELRRAPVALTEEKPRDGDLEIVLGEWVDERRGA